MKALLTLSLILAGFAVTAQTPQSVLQQPLSAGLDLNTQVTAFAGNNYQLVSFDTAGHKEHKYQFTNEGKQTLVVRYLIRDFGKDNDMGIAGNPGIGEVDIQGSFPVIFEMYRQWIDPKVNQAKVQADGSTPWMIDGKVWSSLVRVNPDKGIWLLRTKQN